jgi:hypothetical protein
MERRLAAAGCSWITGVGRRGARGLAIERDAKLVHLGAVEWNGRGCGVA